MRGKLSALALVRGELVRSGTMRGNLSALALGGEGEVVCSGTCPGGSCPPLYGVVNLSVGEPVHGSSMSGGSRTEKSNNMVNQATQTDEN